MFCHWFVLNRTCWLSNRVHNSKHKLTNVKSATLVNESYRIWITTGSLKTVMFPAHCTWGESRRAKHLVPTLGAELLQILTFAPKYMFPGVPSGNMKKYVQPSNKIHLFLTCNELHPLRSAGLAQARARRTTRHTCRKAQQQTKTCPCRLPPQIYNHKQKFCWKIQ